MPWPHVELVSSRVRMVPTREDLLPALFEVTPEGSIPYISSAPAQWTFENFRTWLLEQASSPVNRQYIVLDAQSGKPIGSSSFFAIVEAHRAADIGLTWYTPACRGTHVNPTCKYLMMQYAFEVMNCERIGYKCDSRNLCSARAIEKLGAVREGTLRKFGICADGYVRDTLAFSVIKSEWPSVRDRLRARIGL